MPNKLVELPMCLRHWTIIADPFRTAEEFLRRFESIRWKRCVGRNKTFRVKEKYS